MPVPPTISPAHKGQMSLQRELAVLLCSVLSLIFLVKATFMSLEQLLIVPSTHPLFVKQQSLKIDQKVILDNSPYAFVRGDWQLPTY